jgi:hypothetical protein
MRISASVIPTKERTESGFVNTTNLPLAIIPVKASETGFVCFRTVM